MDTTYGGEESKIELKYSQISKKSLQQSKMSKKTDLDGTKTQDFEYRTTFPEMNSLAGGIPSATSKTKEKGNRSIRSQEREELS